MNEIENISDNSTINLVLDTIKKNKQALVFCNTRKSAEATAEKIANSLNKITKSKNIEKKDFYKNYDKKNNEKNQKIIYDKNYNIYKESKNNNYVKNFEENNNNLEKKEQEILDYLSESVLNVLSTPTKQCKRLALCLKKGIAFHHAGLASEQRSIIENNFRKGIIKVICATPTLSFGLNLPAFRSIIKDLKRYGKHGMDWIPTLEYHQMAGRAGRPDFNDKYGEAICIANNEKEVDEIINRFIKAPPEKIVSKLAVEPVLRTYCLSLIATEYCNTKEDLLNFFKKTFYGKQYGDVERLSNIIDKILTYLDDWDFIMLPKNNIKFNIKNNHLKYNYLENNFRDYLKDNKYKNNNRYKDKKNQNKNFYNETEDFFMTGKEIYENKKNNETNNSENYDYNDYNKIKITIIGKRVSELYIDPYTANFIINSLKRAESMLKSNKVNELSFIQMISQTLELRPLPNLRMSEIEEIENKLEELNLIVNKPNYFDIDYDDFLKSIKLALALNDWMNESSEDDILNEYNISPGELHLKKELADWLLFSTEELCHLLGYMDILKLIKKTKYRLEKGVKEELIPLTKLSNIGRVRARLLYKNGIKDIGDIKKTDLSVLSHLIGKKIAENLKKEVGQDELITHKTKQQTNIEEYKKIK